MRRLLFIICAVFAAASVVSLSSLSASAQTGEQYEASDGAGATQESQETTATQQTTAPEESASGAAPYTEGSVSQGSMADPNAPEVIAAREDLAEEASLPAYSQVVDNTTEGAFQARGWKKENGSMSHENSFVVAERAKAPARFEVKIPTTNDYSVYVWWPGAKDAGVARYSLQTASGTDVEKVDQRTDTSGMWIKLGTYAMKAGQRTVEVATKPVDGGQVFADAVAVVRGDAPPPEERMATSTDARRLERFSGRDIVRQARKHWHDDYAYGTCTKSDKSCTCLTKVSVNPFGHNLGMTESGQWKYDRSRKIPKSNLRPGDEVFFKENGPRGPITHVGIYSGRGNIVHASAFAGWVTETKMRYIKDSNGRSAYFGAKRFKSR